MNQDEPVLSIIDLNEVSRLKERMSLNLLEKQIKNVYPGQNIDLLGSNVTGRIF